MKVHMYFWQGRWWVSRNERHMWRSGLTLNDISHRSLSSACDSARWWFERRNLLEHDGASTA